MKKICKKKLIFLIYYVVGFLFIIEFNFLLLGISIGG